MRKRSEELAEDIRTWVFSWLDSEPDLHGDEADRIAERVKQAASAVLAKELDN